MDVAIIYNDPYQDLPASFRHNEDVIGVMEEVVAVNDALLELGHRVEKIPLRQPLESVEEQLSNIRADCIFNLFEGFDDHPHTEYTVARRLEELNIPITGNPSHVLELTLDKVRAKKTLKKAGLHTPAHNILCPDNISSFNLKFPCIVKPPDEDASNGLSPDSVVYNTHQLEQQVRLISNLFRGYAMVEEFIDGREFNAAVLGNIDHYLVEISEITYSLPDDCPRILTFESKWFENTNYYAGTGVACPAPIDDALRAYIERTVINATQAAGCRGYARVDMRLDEKTGRIMVLEINANPDISPELGIARQAEAIGLSYAQLIQKIVDLALE